MHSLCSLFGKLARGEDGPTAVEYAIMLALILLVCLGAVRSFGSNAGTSFSNSAQSIAS